MRLLLLAVLTFIGCAGPNRPLMLEVVGPMTPVPLVVAVDSVAGRTPALSLVGVVYDPDASQPLPIATVLVGDRGTSSDEDGRFSLDGLAWSDTIRVHYVGFCSVAVTVAELERAGQVASACPAR